MVVADQAGDLRQVGGAAAERGQEQGQRGQGRGGRGGGPRAGRQRGVGCAAGQAQQARLDDRGDIERRGEQGNQLLRGPPAPGFGLLIVATV